MTPAEKMHDAVRVAEDASLQAFVNCYLREVRAGQWHGPAEFAIREGLEFDSVVRAVLELDLPHLGKRLALGIRYRSLVGRHAIHSVYVECDHVERGAHMKRAASAGTEARSWARLDGLSVQLLLIDDIYSEQPRSEQRLELIARVVESHQVMARYVAYRLARDPAPPGHETGFIESEQSTALGHWLHPTPKSRQGMHAWHHQHYVPELGGEFSLHFFAVRRRLVVQESLLDDKAEDLSRRIATHGVGKPSAWIESLLREGYVLVPTHPLQAHFLIHQAHVRDLMGKRDVIDAGPMGPKFKATSSVRTVYSPELEVMLKLSIPVKLTNSLRVNLQSELGDSVHVTHLLRKCDLERQCPGFFVMEDPAYISVSLPDMDETGFEAIFRENPFVDCGPGRDGSIHSGAALVQEPLTDTVSSVLAELVRLFASRHELSLEMAARRWFEAYLDVAVDPILSIYDRHGIALEAHQQNSVIAFASDGRPVACYYRDVQGIGLSNCHKQALIRLVPELAFQPKVFEPDEVVRDGLGYYLVLNHLYAVVHRIGVDGFLDEEQLLSLVERRFAHLRPRMNLLGKAFIDGFFERDEMLCKANLLTRAADLDELEEECELAVYCSVENPLARIHREATVLKGGVTSTPALVPS